MHASCWDCSHTLTSLLITTTTITHHRTRQCPAHSTKRFISVISLSSININIWYMVQFVPTYGTKHNAFFSRSLSLVFFFGFVFGICIYWWAIRLMAFEFSVHRFLFFFFWLVVFFLLSFGRIYIDKWHDEERKNQRWRWWKRMKTNKLEKKEEEARLLCWYFRVIIKIEWIEKRKKKQHWSKRNHFKFYRWSFWMMEPMMTNYGVYLYSQNWN